MKNSIFTFPRLLRAYHACRKNKRRTVNAAKFELDFEKELLRLETELRSRTYRPGRSICFVVTEPTLREVFAADFRDRVVHHLLVGWLEPIFEKKFIHHSYACRREKGAIRAVADLRRFLRKLGDRNSSPAYYLQADVAAFFMSLKKDILYDIISRYVKNPDILWLARQIIFHDPTANYSMKGDPRLFSLIPPHKSLFSVPPGQGLPIGNLTSQFFANVYLNELDQFVKHCLKIKYYLRYVDDILILHHDPGQLKTWLGQIDNFLKTDLKLRLHPKKSRIKPVSSDIDFVGFIVRPRRSLVRRRIVANFKRKLREFNRYPLPETEKNFQKLLEHILAAVNSYCGQFRHALTFNLRRALYYRHFRVLKSWLEPADADFRHFRIKRRGTR